jgi:hypothetical protein
MPPLLPNKLLQRRLNSNRLHNSPHNLPHNSPHNPLHRALRQRRLLPLHVKLQHPVPRLM